MHCFKNKQHFLLYLKKVNKRVIFESEKNNRNVLNVRLKTDTISRVWRRAFHYVQKLKDIVKDNEQTTK